MPPIDPSPYRTIASALNAARAGRIAPPKPASRTKAALRTYLERNAPSSQAAQAAAERVASAVQHRFRDTHSDYPTSHPHVAPGFTTKR